MTDRAVADSVPDRTSAHGPRFIDIVGALDRRVRRRPAAVLEPLSPTIAEYSALSLLRSTLMQCVGTLQNDPAVSSPPAWRSV